MTRLRAAAALLLTLLMLAASPAWAQTFPAYTGLVVDNANVLPADVEASLTAKLEAMQLRTKRQLVVVTVPTTQDYALTDYGYKLGRTWGVGLRDVNNGVILFAAPGNPPGQRGPRIEVGRGLEPVLTDALSRVIIETRMMPRIEANDVPGAIVAGADAIIEQLRLPDADAAKRVAAAEAEFDATHARRARGGGGFSPAIGLVLIIAAVAMIALRSGRRRGQVYRDGGGSGGSSLPIILWGMSELGRGGGWGGGGGSSWGDNGGGGGGSSDGSWGGGGFTGGGGGDFGGGGASGNW